MPPNHPKDRYRVVACRECRRSKTKCNRVWPCHACVKRGCDDICPDGVLIKPNHDKVLDTPLEAAKLVHENKRLTARIQELEKTISSQVSHSSRSDSNSIPDPSARDGSEMFPQEVVNALGTLSIGDFGESNHHNQTASSEYLLQNDFERARNYCNVVTLDGAVLPKEILYIAEPFPHSRPIRSTPELRHMILSFVPPADKVLVMVDRYYRSFAWMYDPLPRDQFMDRVYNRIFFGNCYGDISDVPLDHVAILFLILALSLTVDLEQPFSDATSEPYYLIALAAFNLETRLSAPTIASIQAMKLVTTYSCMSERNNSEERWLLVGITLRMAQSAGLYRDFSSWSKSDHIETERRRRLFWELYFYDTWLSFVMGRPTVLANSNKTGTKFPQDLNSTVNASGNSEPGFHRWKYEFAKDCLVPLLDDVHGMEPPTYQTILRLDASVRQYPVPSSLQLPPVDAKRMSVESSLEMQGYFIFWLKETILLYLHRSYFAHALSKAPAKPFQSRYGPSVLAAYRSATLLVTRLRQLSLDYPVTSRIWTFGSSAFSAAIVLGALVVRSPTCRVNLSALDGLDSGVRLLERSPSSPRCIKALSILRNLQQRAHLIYAKHTVTNKEDGTVLLEDRPEEDELAICDGQTRLGRLVLGSSLADVGGNVRDTSSQSTASLKTMQSPRDSLINTYPELCNAINTVTPFESLSAWDGVPLQAADGIVPDFTGFNFGMTASHLQNYDPLASTPTQQAPPAWQNLMSEVGLPNEML